jgi:hypothetical protein
MAKIKVGDVFSIKTSKGFAYLHYIGKGWDEIEKIRVLDGIFMDGCSDCPVRTKSAPPHLQIEPFLKFSRANLALPRQGESRSGSKNTH